MALPWFRMDANFASHDKVLALLADPSPKRWQAAASYVFALGWATGHGTNGAVPPYALAMVHGTPTTARLLVKYRLWTESLGAGWRIVNFDKYQELAEVAELKREARSSSGRKAACLRWHGKSCGCWREAQ